MKNFFASCFSEERLKIAGWLFLPFIVLLLLFPKTDLSLPKPENKVSAISAYDENSVRENLFEITLLGDSSPLFLPTSLNFGVPESDLPQSGSKLANTKKESPMEAMKTFEVSFSLRGGYEIPTGFFLKNLSFSNFMRSDLKPVDAARNSGALMTIVSANTGEIVHSSHIDVGVDSDGALWSPVKMTLAVAEDGSVSPPLITSVSGIEELDFAFENYLRNNLNKILWEKDEKGGFYEVIFSP